MILGRGRSPCRYRLPSQQHLYMEPQAAVAQPDEGGMMTVYSGTQGLGPVHQAVATALGAPLSNITIGVWQQQ